ncbi:hypothetical protein B0S90_0337 [Caldicellulosiruptor bescii]|uniref:Uncharacterized protein n=2 Tax=Caldicellulosiruptor bescii TaxID=31899 RepID=B9MLM3_CALBD|nr:hypothetical protein [Caldicellulosiruptor bescii]ACM59231.1 hypothetical protein Athe_0069 [Caldicellulosiruptor bescii DSM 6725]PBC88311.1 hypothetical protein B0S87_1288 [Caldicellulosiruptor bescii]PBC92208.1 hypothetical protein B0S89_2705 [Caldicellulosiruptor bescii]PBD04982.1 hypothetical protein B0S85_2702 [Caldicellulosiruptor bescii]PBD05387.1 hypothetical protein B0S90_0337 [Caldicellulosiruptor bescii]
MKKGLRIFLVFFTLLLVTILTIKMMSSKSLKTESRNVKEYAEVVPFELNSLSKREQLLFDILNCEEKKSFKIYLNKLRSQHLIVWTEEYANGKKWVG